MFSKDINEKAKFANATFKFLQGLPSHILSYIYGDIVRKAYALSEDYPKEGRIEMLLASFSIHTYYPNEISKLAALFTSDDIEQNIISDYFLGKRSISTIDINKLDMPTIEDLILCKPFFTSVLSIPHAEDFDLTERIQEIIDSGDIPGYTFNPFDYLGFVNVFMNTIERPDDDHLRSLFDKWYARGRLFKMLFSIFHSDRAVLLRDDFSEYVNKTCKIDQPLATYLSDSELKRYFESFEVPVSGNKSVNQMNPPKSPQEQIDELVDRTRENNPSQNSPRAMPILPTINEEDRKNFWNDFLDYFKHDHKADDEGNDSEWKKLDSIFSCTLEAFSRKERTDQVEPFFLSPTSKINDLQNRMAFFAHCYYYALGDSTEVKVKKKIHAVKFYGFFYNAIRPPQNDKKGRFANFPNCFDQLKENSKKEIKQIFKKNNITIYEKNEEGKR